MNNFKWRVYSLTLPLYCLCVLSYQSWHKLNISSKPFYPLGTVYLPSCASDSVFAFTNFTHLLTYSLTYLLTYVLTELLNSNDIRYINFLDFNLINIYSKLAMSLIRISDIGKQIVISHIHGNVMYPRMSVPYPWQPRLCGAASLPHCGLRLYILQ